MYVEHGRGDTKNPSQAESLAPGDKQIRKVLKEAP